MLDQIWQEITPVIVQVVVGVIVTVAGVIYARVQAEVKKLTGLEIETLNRAKLNEALMTAAGLVMNSTLSNQEKIDYIKTYAAKSVPDAFVYFGDQLKDVINEKAQNALDALLNGISPATAANVAVSVATEKAGAMIADRVTDAVANVGSRLR